MQSTALSNPVREHSSQTNSRGLPRLVTVCLLLAIIPTFAVYGIRIHSLLEQGSFTETTGYEGPMIYGVWKAAHHFPLYESLIHPLSSNTLYNYLFYKSYGVLISGVAPNDPIALLVSRLTTCLFATLGVLFCCIASMVLAVSNDGRRLPNALLAAALFWFSTSPVGWFGISVRPDVAAVAMASLGLLFLLLYLKNSHQQMLLYSSLAFFLAWSFKQSVILTFIGAVCIHILLIRNLRALMLQVLPFTICVGVALYIGGADYRFNILVVPTLGSFAANWAWTFPSKAVLENPLLYGSLALAALFLIRQNSAVAGDFQKFSIHNRSAQVLVFAILIVVTFLGGFALCFRAGADRNYFFEAGVVACVGLVPGLSVLFDGRRRFAKAWTVLGTTAVATVCLIQLASYGLQRSQATAKVWKLPLLGASEFGRLALLSEGQMKARLGLASYIAAQPKPVLVMDDIFSQPFYSTGGLFPAFVQDPNISSDLLKHRIIRTDPMAAAITGHVFPTLLLHDPDLSALALREGYVFSGGVDGYLQGYNLPR